MGFAFDLLVVIIFEAVAHCVDQTGFNLVVHPLVPALHTLRLQTSTRPPSYTVQPSQFPLLVIRQSTLQEQRLRGEALDD